MSSMVDVGDLTNQMRDMNVTDTKAKTSIFCFARMNPPHKGHGKLIINMLAIKNSLMDQKLQNVHIHILLQSRTEPQKNPLSFRQRKNIIDNYLVKLGVPFDIRSDIFIEQGYSSQNAFKKLRKQGYERFYFIMGDDRRNGFTNPDYELNGSTKNNMYNTIQNTGIQWTKLGDIDNKFFERNESNFSYEIKLKSIVNDDKLETYSDWTIPVIDTKNIMSIINSRPQGEYKLQDLDNISTTRDVKEVSATSIRDKIQNLNMKDINNWSKIAIYKDLVNILLPQGNPNQTQEMIRQIKENVAVSNPSHSMKQATESRQKRTNSQEIKRSNDTINVLSYNTSWEASQPLVDWMKGYNLYGPPGRENGIGHLCGRNELYKKGVLISDNPMDNPCRKNIFDLIKNGKYDFVGMQEYVHTWGGKSVFKDAMESLKNYGLTLVKHAIEAFGKEIEIGSLYNHKRFELINTALNEFLVVKGGQEKTDGRPAQGLLLRKNDNGKYIIFLNAHFPQTRMVQGRTMEDKAEYINKVLSEVVDNLLTNAGVPNKVLKENIDIILAADTNDVNLEFVNKIKIKLYNQEIDLKLGSNIKHKPTCCTHLVKNMKMESDGYSKPPSWGNKYIEDNEGNKEINPRWGKSYVSWKAGDEFTRENQRKRYGDVIMYSVDDIFEYQFPKETDNEPYSDHAPIAAKLTPKAESTGGKKRTRKKRKRKRKKTKKRRRKKSTKKKKRRRRRKNTKKKRR